MADVLGTIDTTITWAHRTVQVVKGIAAARHDVAVLIKDLEDSLFILNETKSLFASVDKQEEKPEGQKKWLDELIKTTCKEFGEVLERLERAFQVKTTSHGQFHSFVDRTWKGAKWYMQKSDMEDWIAKIEKQNGAIKSMVQILDAMNGRDIMTSQNYIQDAMSQDRFFHVVEKLPVQEENPVEILERISQSLPEWVLGDIDYKKWIDEHSTDNNWLWMLGAAGSGKSHIATYVFDQLWRSSPQDKDLSAHNTVGFQEDGRALKEDDALEAEDDNDEPHTHEIRPTGSASAIYYCNDGMSDSQTANHIFRTIVRQLVQQLWAVAPQSAYTHVATLSALSGGDAATQDAKPAHKVLADVAECLVRAYIVIDALDELPTPALRDLLPKLRDLRQQCPHLKVFTTSRDGMRADAANNRAVMLESSRNASTLRTFVWVQLASVRLQAEEVDRAAHDADEAGNKSDSSSSYGDSALPKLVQSEEALESVGGRIVEVAAGNFLAAELLIQRLMNEKEDASLQDAIGNLSGALGDLIAEAVERIDTQRSQELAAIGRHTLLWVSHAPKGSMRVNELRHALALSLYGDPAKWQDLSSKIVLEATGYFVSVEAASISVHKAVQDFCLDPCKGAAYFPDAHGIMAKACLACLDACIAPCRDDKEWDEAKQASPFLGYASTNWGWHLALAEEAMPATPFRRLELMRILDKNKALDAVTMAIQPRLRKLGIWRDGTMGALLRTRRSPRPISVVHMLALFNLPLTARKWLVHSGQDADGLQHLLDHSSQDSGPDEYCSALYLASTLGHDAVVQVLMEARADPLRLNGPHRTTALVVAIHQGFVRTVVALLARDSAEAMVQQRAPGVRRMLPLAVACGSPNRRGSARIVREILAVMEEMDNYTEMLLDRAGPKGLTALHRAAEGGDPAVIEALLDAPGGDALLELDSSRNNHETPLLTAGGASWREGNAAVPCLVGRGADVTARNTLGDTPLHALARHEGHVRLDKTECFEWLLPHVLDLSVQNHQGQTVLHVACHEGRSAHVAVLLAPNYLERTRANFSIADKNGRTPIMVAAHARGGPISKAHVHCVRLLIPHAAQDMSLSDAAALYDILLRQDKPKAVEMLLNHIPGLEDHVTRHGTWTLLHQAIEAGHLRMVKLAMRRGGKRDLETPNAAGEKPLWEAQRRMNADVASYLLEQGAAVGSNVPGAALRLCVDLSDDMLTRALWRREPTLLRPREKTDDRADAVRRMSVRNAVYRLWRDHDILPAPQIPVREVLCLQARRDEEVEVSRPMNGEAGVYLETEPLGPEVKIPLSRLEITITAQDQGWSDWQDQHPHHKGTFHGSDTWFEVALKRDGSLVRQLECTRNLLNVGDWTTYRVVWGGELEAPEIQVPDGMRHGHARLAGLRRGDAQRFVAMMRGGDQVLVLPRSRGAGWVCRVKSVEVNAWFEEDGSPC